MGGAVEEAMDGLVSRLETIQGLRVLTHPPVSVGELPAAVLLFESREPALTLSGSAFSGSIKAVVLAGPADRRRRSRRWAVSWARRASAASRRRWRPIALGAGAWTTGAWCRWATLGGASCGAGCMPRRTSTSSLRSRHRVGSRSPPYRRAVVSGSGLEPGLEGAHVYVDLVGGLRPLAL